MEKITVKAQDIRKGFDVFNTIRIKMGNNNPRYNEWYKILPMYYAIPTNKTCTKFYKLDGSNGYEEYSLLLSKNLPHAWLMSEEKFDELLTSSFMRVSVTDNIEKLILRVTKFKCDRTWFRDLTNERSSQWVLDPDSRGDFKWEWFNNHGDVIPDSWKVRGHKYKLYGRPDSREDWYRNLYRSKTRVCRKCKFALEEQIPESHIEIDIEITIDFKGTKKRSSALQHLYWYYYIYRIQRRQEMAEKFIDFQKKCAILKEKDPTAKVPTFAVFASKKFQNQYHLYFVSNGKLEETEKYYPFMEQLNRAINGENARQKIYHGWGCSSSFHGPDSHNRHSAD